MKTDKKIYFYQQSIHKTVYTVLAVVIVLTALIPILTKKYMLFILPAFLAFIGFTTIKSLFAKDISLNKTEKLLRTSGDKFTGKVIGYKKHKLLQQMVGQTFEQVENLDSDIYTLVIKYAKGTFETPAIVYNPATLLASDDCTVYVSGDSVMALDFAFRANDETSIELEEILDEKED